MGDDYGYDMVAEGTEVSEYDQDIPQPHTTDQPMAVQVGVA